MLYLKSIVLDKFKSFRHAELLFSKGFTCVVGPNGSGKSVIFDSLMFGLGEPSLQILRVDKLDELINRNIKRKPDEPIVAHVKMEFEGDGQAATVIKTVRSDSKTAYRLNGKLTTRKEVIEFLSSNGVRVDDTTTIAQGEINAIAAMNSRDRRGLIDMAAGIKDFEYKKAEALKELDKVEQNINVANAQLHERQGFLNELEKEKEAAEKWTKMKQRLNSLRYSILVARQAELKSASEGSAKEIAILDSKKNDSSYKLNDINTRRSQLNSEREEITRELSRLSSTSGETSSKIQGMASELAKLDTEVLQIQRSMDEKSSLVSQSSQEMVMAKEQTKANSASVESLNKKIGELEAEFGRLAVLPEGADMDKELKEIDAAIQSAENMLVDIEGYISKLQADQSVANSRKSDAETSLKDLEKNSDRLAKLKLEKDRELEAAKDRLIENAQTMSKLNPQTSKIKMRLSAIDGELYRLMEQRAQAQSREGNLGVRISEKFGEKDGFYGKASKLCEYESKYAYAVEVSAANRFEYFVVDSMSVASRIITYLKQNGMGRATFIPIGELNVEKVQQRERDITPIIEYVKYDPKFSKVFSYIFNNTYVIDRLEDSKKYGIGKHRYVTLEGELVEQAGIISGGSAKRISLATIEGKIKELDDEKTTLRSNADMVEESLRATEKEKYLLDSQIGSLTTELKSAKDDLARCLKGQSDLNSQITELSAHASSISEDIVKRDKEKLEIVSSLNSKKDARAAIYERFMSASKFTKSEKYKEEKAKSERIRDEMEANRIKRAELNKEIQLLEQKAKDLGAAVSESQKQIKEHRSDLRDKEIRKDLLAKSKLELEKELSGKSESSKKVFSRVSAIESELNKLSQDFGEISAAVSNLDRQINEIRIRRSQSETRLNDITAELSTYDKSTEVLKDKIEEMETEVNVLNVKISELGNVNLKAPELYEERKKLTEEAQSRVDTLHTEKDAVLRMMEEIDSKKLQTFMEMLNEVNKNFGKLYNQVFPGKGSIALEDEKDPLNSGIYIRMADGKTEIPLKSLSGGQKSIIALMLLFSIHLCKKSSLYLFDEVDAALDSENAKLLSKLIKEMSRDAQFIVISHNNSLIVNADTAIGVAMSERKESNAVGLEVGTMIKGKP